MRVRDPAAPEVIDCDQGLRNHGLRLSAVATGQSFYSDGWALTTGDPHVRTRLDDRILRMVDLAAPWKAMVVIGGVRGTLTGSESDRSDQYRRAVESVQRYAEYARSSQVSLAVEPINRYETNFLNTIEQAGRFIDDVDLDNVGLLADTFHMNLEEADLSEALRSAGDRLLHVQFTDSNRLAAGWGHIDFPALASALREVGYKGYLSTETLPSPDSRAAARQAIELFRRL